MVQIGRGRQIAPRLPQVVLHAEFPAVVHLLPQLPAQLFGGVHPPVHHKARHHLPPPGAKMGGLPLVEEKAPLAQLRRRRLVDARQPPVAGEGQIVAVACVGDPPVPAPRAQAQVKVPQHQVGGGGEVGAPWGRASR